MLAAKLNLGPTAIATRYRSPAAVDCVQDGTRHSSSPYPRLLLLLLLILVFSLSLLPPSVQSTLPKLPQCTTD
jgi:hypothetical protein